MSRRRHDQQPSSERGWFERFLFTFMGPPQLGDVSAPPAAPQDPAVLACSKCGSPWDGHEIVRTASRTYPRCPPAAGGR